MNGKAAQLERWLMAIRQRALTNTLGQVTCGSRWHSFGLEVNGRCPACGAAL